MFLPIEEETMLAVETNRFRDTYTWRLSIHANIIWREKSDWIDRDGRKVEFVAKEKRARVNRSPQTGRTNEGEYRARDTRVAATIPQ